MKFIQNNGGTITVAAVVLAIVAGYMEWRVSVIVGAEMDAVGLVSTDRVTSIEKDMAETRETHAADSTRMDGKIERIVDILLEE